MDLNKGTRDYMRWKSGPGQWFICPLFLGTAQELVAVHFCCSFFRVYPSDGHDSLSQSSKRSLNGAHPGVGDETAWDSMWCVHWEPSSHQAGPLIWWSWSGATRGWCQSSQIPWCSSCPSLNEDIGTPLSSPWSQWFFWPPTPVKHLKITTLDARCCKRSPHRRSSSNARPWAGTFLLLWETGGPVSAEWDLCFLFSCCAPHQSAPFSQ